MIRCSCHALRDRDFKEAVEQVGAERLAQEGNLIKDSAAVFREAIRIRGCHGEKSCSQPCLAVAAEFLQSAGYYPDQSFPDRRTRRQAPASGAAPAMAAE